MSSVIRQTTRRLNTRCLIIGWYVRSGAQERTRTTGHRCASGIPATLVLATFYAHRLLHDAGHAGAMRTLERFVKAPDTTVDSLAASTTFWNGSYRAKALPMGRLVSLSRKSRKFGACRKS